MNEVVKKPGSVHHVFCWKNTPCFVTQCIQSTQLSISKCDTRSPPDCDSIRMRSRSIHPYPNDADRCSPLPPPLCTRSFIIEHKTSISDSPLALSFPLLTKLFLHSRAAPFIPSSSARPGSPPRSSSNRILEISRALERSPPLEGRMQMCHGRGPSHGVFRVIVTSESSSFRLLEPSWSSSLPSRRVTESDSLGLGDDDRGLGAAIPHPSREADLPLLCPRRCGE